MDVAQISDQDVETLFGFDEGHFLDFKRIDIQPAKMQRTVSAFANADGGEFYIGIYDPSNGGSKTWDGFNNPEAANAHIQAIEAILPLGSNYRAEFFHWSGGPGLVLHVEVFKTRDIVKTAAGEIYVRKSAQNLPVRSDDAIARLRLNKGISSFETETVNADFEVISNSTVIIDFLINVIPHSEPEKWLAKQMLVTASKPTVAGVTLFAEVPQALLPKRCGIKIYRYKTNAEEGTREVLDGIPATVEGCLYEQIATSVAMVKKLIESIKRMTLDGLVEIEYPEETLHEIITNAVIHRDYSIPDDVHIRIYDNRVEVESPGTLPGHVTVQNILDERFARNGNIVRILNKFPNPPNRDVGEGLNTAFRAMEMLKLKKPDIVPRLNSVVVYIRHERLASPEDMIMNFLSSSATINNGKAREICVIREDWRIRSIFKRMVDAGMLEKVPGSMTSNTSYRAVPG